MSGLSRLRGGRLTEHDRASVDRMTHAVLHRGPDGTSTHEDARSCFGFQRLSLLAPENGDQPFVHRDGDVVLMVNGEVYNHRQLEADLAHRHQFRTKSDCEVLLHGYLDEGLGFLQKVRGMYAFALLDNRTDTLILGRDRFGIKPLYFHADDERLVFASEIKALFRDSRTPRRLDWHGALADPALNLDLTLVDGPVNTWFEDVHVVPAAHTVSIDLTTGRRTTTRYWNPHTAADVGDLPAAEFVDTYRDLLASSVSECLTADCEVGMLLSGGIDSAAVAAFATGSGVHTFTALTGSTVVNGDAEYSHRTAAHCGLPNHQIMFDVDRIPTAAEWRSLLWLLETPQASPEHFYKSELHRFARATRPELKAMLLGQASDEFNGGYSSKLSGGRGWDDFMATIAGMARNTYLRANPAMRPWHAEGHGALLRVPGVASDDVYRQFVDWKIHDIEQYNTWHEDRTAAGNSIEARVPFLDHRIVELTNAVPVSMRAELFWDKSILRRALAGHLPPEIISRPKVSFYYDDGGYNNQKTFIRMLTAGGGELLEEALSSAGAKELVDRDRVQELVAGLRSDPSLPALEYLLGVVNLGLLENMLDEQPSVAFAPDRIEVPEELVVDEWDASRGEIDRRVFDDRQLDEETVARIDADVRFLVDAHDPQVRLLTVDDVVTYAFEDDDAQLWVDVLGRFTRGPARIADVARDVGAEVERVLEMAATAHREGLLTVVEDERVSAAA